MKKIIFAILLYPLFSSSQTIDGIGKIKLLRTYHDVITDLEMKESDFINPNKEPARWIDIYEINKNFLLIFDTTETPEPLYMEYERCQDAKQLLLKDYSVAGISISKIKLTFLRDTLVDIYISNPTMKLIDAVSAKYGDGTLDTKENIVTCTSIYGEFRKKEERFFKRWPTKAGFVAEYLLADVLDSKCKRLLYSYLLISKKNSIDFVRECSAKQINIQNEKEKKMKKEKLTDF